MSEAELTEQRFIYAGKRMTTDKKLVPSWLPEGADAESESDLRLFPKTKGLAVGAIYTIEVGGDRYRPDSVSYTGDHADREVTLLLESRDRVDGSRHALLTLERNAARSSELKELCAPLRELVGKQVGWANRAALLSYITSEIGRG